MTEIERLKIERDEALVAKDFANLACEKLEARLEEAWMLLSRPRPNMHTTETCQWFTDRDAWLSAHTPTGKE